MKIIFTGSNDPKFRNMVTALRNVLEGHEITFVDTKHITKNRSKEYKNADLFVCAHHHTPNAQYADPFKPASAIEVILKNYKKATLGIPTNLSPKEANKIKTEMHADFITAEPLCELNSNILKLYILNALEQAPAINEAKKTRRHASKKSTAPTTDDIEKEKQKELNQKLNTITAELGMEGSAQTIEIPAVVNFILQKLMNNAPQDIKINGQQLREEFNNQSGFLPISESRIRHELSKTKSLLNKLFKKIGLDKTHTDCIFTGKTGSTTDGYSMDPFTARQLIITKVEEKAPAPPKPIKYKPKITAAQIGIEGNNTRISLNKTQHWGLNHLMSFPDGQRVSSMDLAKEYNKTNTPNITRSSMKEAIRNIREALNHLFNECGMKITAEECLIAKKAGYALDPEIAKMLEIHVLDNV